MPPIAPFLVGSCKSGGSSGDCSQLRVSLRPIPYQSRGATDAASASASPLEQPRRRRLYDVAGLRLVRRPTRGWAISGAIRLLSIRAFGKPDLIGDFDRHRHSGPSPKATARPIASAPNE